MSCGADAAPTRQQCNRTTEANPKQHCAAADCIQSGVLARHTSHGRPMDNTRGLRAMNVGFQSLGWQLPGCSNFCNGSRAGLYRRAASGRSKPRTSHPQDVEPGGVTRIAAATRP